MDAPALFIITGPRSAGKTTLCAGLVRLARQAGRQVAGVLSIGVFEDGQKVAIDVQDLRSGERRRLAQRRQAGQPVVGAQTPGWHFDPSALAWGNTLLQTATPTDLLIVDELGPLELEQGQGWTAGLPALDSGFYRWSLVVIRPELLAIARQRWPTAKIISIAVTNRALPFGGLGIVRR